MSAIDLTFYRFYGGKKRELSSVLPIAYGVFLGGKPTQCDYDFGLNKLT